MSERITDSRLSPRVFDHLPYWKLGASEEKGAFSITLLTCKAQDQKKEVRSSVQQQLACPSSLFDVEPPWQLFLSMGNALGGESAAEKIDRNPERTMSGGAAADVAAQPAQPAQRSPQVLMAPVRPGKVVSGSSLALAGAADDAKLASVGSAAHHTGACTPCAYFARRWCKRGVECRFCHDRAHAETPIGLD
mmetsp:Transcript_68933/g.180687  ORF Transcript_68933/g.180687 Transcript_68933/m.180687 type:complete len:192 (-) Transcript_68933:64-639(-)